MQRNLNISNQSHMSHPMLHPTTHQKSHQISIAFNYFQQDSGPVFVEQDEFQRGKLENKKQSVIVTLYITLSVCLLVSPSVEVEPVMETYIYGIVSILDNLKYSMFHNHPLACCAHMPFLFVSLSLCGR